MRAAARAGRAAPVSLRCVRPDIGAVERDGLPVGHVHVRGIRIDVPAIAKPCGHQETVVGVVRAGHADRLGPGSRARAAAECSVRASVSCPRSLVVAFPNRAVSRSRGQTDRARRLEVTWAIPDTDPGV